MTVSLEGVPVSPGRVSGPVVRVVDSPKEPDRNVRPADRVSEAARISPAAQAVATVLEAQAANASGDAAAVLWTASAMAADPALISKAEHLVTEEGLSAPRAVFEAANSFSESLSSVGDYLAERVRDVEDIRDRIIAELLGIGHPGVPELTLPSVLIARDLAPADTAVLDPEKVLALATEEGGPTSHTAILARSLGIPAVVAVRGLLQLDTQALTVDGDSGLVTVIDLATAVRQSTESASRPKWDGVGGTSDGHRTALYANVGTAEDARSAVAAGAEGIGLFRTEFCYLNASVEPSVAAQHAAYAEVLSPFAGKPVIVRTLDAGADKPLPFLNSESSASGRTTEPNPALGVRGLRIALSKPELLERQLDAIAAAATDSGAEVSVMAPMIATAAEARWFADRARSAGLERVGVMIEIPAAALAVEQILKTVDFVSLGTNDLAQYTFAADRQLGAVAALNDPWQPALLRLLEIVGAGGKSADKPVGVCGEAAADPLLSLVLCGLGVTSLSMNNASLATVGASLRAVSYEDCQRAAQVAINAPDPVSGRKAVRALISGSASY